MGVLKIITVACTIKWVTKGQEGQERSEKVSSTLQVYDSDFLKFIFDVLAPFCNFHFLKEINLIFG